MRVLGSGGAKLAAREARCAKDGEKWAEKVVLDRPPSPEAMVDKQMGIESQRVVKWGGGVGVVGRGCIPGGIGAEKRAASHAGLAYTDPRAKNRAEIVFWAQNRVNMVDF